jgi:hypothetical protein
MATLQPTRQWSATTARTRLKQITRERPAQPSPAPELTLVGSEPEATPGPAVTPPTAATPRPYHDRLAELEQRQLLLQTVTIYPGWRLVSVQHRPESDVLVAHLIPDGYDGDPVLAIREGHALQIIMDAIGDFKVQRPRRKRANIVARGLRWLASILSSSSYSVAAA